MSGSQVLLLYVEKGHHNGHSESVQTTVMFLFFSLQMEDLVFSAEKC